MQHENYGELFESIVDRLCKFYERSEVFRLVDIKRMHFYNVINPNKLSSSGNPYHAPIEWLVRLTNFAKDYSMLKVVSKDCGCILLTPDDIEELKENEDPEKTLRLFMKIIGKAKGE